MLRARKHRKVSMAKVLEQKLEVESFQYLSASRVASQIPCEPKSPFPKQMWRPKQKALYEASGGASSQVRPSRKEKRQDVCDETISREVTTAIMSSPNLGAVTPRAILVLMSETTIPQGKHDVHSREARTKHHSVLRSLILQVLSSLFIAKLRDCP